MVRLTEHEGVSRETVRRRLAEDDLKPWRRDMWCIPQADASSQVYMCPYRRDKFFRLGPVKPRQNQFPAERQISRRVARAVAEEGVEGALLKKAA